MRKRFLTSLLTLTISAAHVQASGEHGKTGAYVHWGYGGSEGPEYWGELSADYALCKKGKNQSPIDIVNPIKRRGLDVIAFAYKPSAIDLLNNGHTIKADYAPGSAMRVGGETYHLLQLHFHTPSENRVSGRSYPMEAHLVHQSAGGRLAVVGALFVPGRENPTLTQLWEFMPKQPGREKSSLTFNAEALLPRSDRRDYYFFSGSLTTPPCTEGVNWYVFNTPIEASPEQFAAFTRTIHENARPPQPLNNRMVVQKR